MLTKLGMLLKNSIGGKLGKNPSKFNMAGKGVKAEMGSSSRIDPDIPTTRNPTPVVDSNRMTDQGTGQTIDRATVTATEEEETGVTEETGDPSNATSASKKDISPGTVPTKEPSPGKGGMTGTGIGVIAGIGMKGAKGSIGQDSSLRSTRCQKTRMNID